MSVAPASEDNRDEPAPQQFTAEEPAGCTRLLAAWLRRQGAQGKSNGGGSGAAPAE